MSEPMKIELDAMFGDILQSSLNSGAARLYVILNSIHYIDSSDPRAIKQQEEPPGHDRVADDRQYPS